MKNVIFKFMTLTACACLVFACSDNNESSSDDTSGTVKVNPVQIEAAEGEYSMPFTLSGKASAKDITATCDVDWISDITVGDNALTFKAKSNTGDSRKAIMTLTLGENEPVSAAVIQKYYDFDAFSISVSDITSSSCTATINPKSYKGNYYFMVYGKAYVDNYLSLDTAELGDQEYGEALFQSELEWLQSTADEQGSTLAEVLTGSTAFYKVTTTGASTIMPYGSRSPLSYDSDYYLVVFGLTTDGERTTPIALRSFHTLDIDRSDITFEMAADHITPNSASITVTPSNEDYYYWTYISEMDYSKLDNDKDAVMNNMIANLKTTIATYGGKYTDYLNTGVSSETVDQLWAGTTYYVIAWGMDENGNQTTDAFEVGTFKTEDQEYSDPCRFGISVTESSPIDFKIKVEPTVSTTRYYIAPVAASYLSGYDKYQFAQRIINMQTERYEDSSVNWSNDDSSIFTGTVEKWANQDLGWVVRAKTRYVIFVFGVAADGTRTTDVDTLGFTTPAGSNTSDMTFQVTFDEITWRNVTYTVTPSVTNERYLPFIVETAEIDDNGLRKSDGSLEDDAIYEQIVNYYSEDGSNAMDYASRRGVQQMTFATGIYSEHKYSLLLFGYNGSKTTKIYEFTFETPAIPFDKSDAEVSLEKFEFFEGSDLYALDSARWEAYKDAQVIHIVIKPNESCTNYYAGMWPTESHWANEGGRDYIVKLVQMENLEGNNFYKPQTDKVFGGISYGFFDYNSQWTTPDGTTTVSATPWEFIWYGEGSDGNYGHYNYKYFILRPKDYTIKDGDIFDIKPSEAYDFWTGNEVSSITLSVSKDGEEVKEVNFR
jgi:hypothetical protein